MMLSKQAWCTSPRSVPWGDVGAAELGSLTCVDGSYCVDVEPFEWLYELGSEDSQRWASTFEIPEAEIPRLLDTAVWVSISDFRGGTPNWHLGPILLIAGALALAALVHRATSKAPTVE